MKVYLAGPPEVGDEYVEAQARLERRGHEVLCNPVPDPELRWAIADLTTCDAICLMELWWSDVNAVILQHIAGWLRLKHLDPTGEKIPTTNIGGPR